MTATITQVLTSLPANPDPAVDDPPTFSTKGAASVLAQKNMVVELQTWTAQANAVATDVNANAAAAAASAAAAAASQSAASAVALAAANFHGAYSACSGAAAVPYSVFHLGRFWMLLSNLANVTTKVPGTDAEWQLIGVPLWIRKTANYTATSFERIKASTTAGAWSLTFPPAPNNGDEIEVMDIDGTFDVNNLTLLANGKKIMGFTTSWVLDTQLSHLVFVYDTTTGDWRI